MIFLKIALSVVLGNTGWETFPKSKDNQLLIGCCLSSGGFCEVRKPEPGLDHSVGPTYHSLRAGGSSFQGGLCTLSVTKSIVKIKKGKEKIEKDWEGWDCEEIKGEQTCFCFYLVTPCLWGVSGAREEHPQASSARTWLITWMEVLQ